MGWPKGKPKSDKIKAKISAAKTGKVMPAWVGVRISAANKAKLELPGARARLIALLQSPDVTARRLVVLRSRGTRAKMSAAKKGKPKSAATKAKMSAAKLGKPRPDLKGKPRSAEIKARISAANKGKVCSVVARAKMSVAKKGKSLSAITKTKMSVSQKRRSGLVKNELRRRFMEQGRFSVWQSVRGENRAEPVLASRVIREAPLEKVAEVVSGLPLRQRQIIELSFGFEGRALGLPEMARNLRLSEAEVKRLYGWAMVTIKKQLLDLP